MSNPNNPELKSFIDIPENHDFPIQNLPYGCFKRKNAPNEQGHLGVAIGDYILDLNLLEKDGILKTIKSLFQEKTLNQFMSCDRNIWIDVRQKISNLLRHDEAALRDHKDLHKKYLVKQEEAQLQLAVAIGDYTDFYASKEHASNVGSMFRDKDNPLLPNWTHLPVGYHGRASSVVISGTPIHRPWGQILPLNETVPQFSPSKRVDFELEMASFVGVGNSFGSPIKLSNSKNHLFGMVLMNDWSARDIQKWEYVPLGPFVAKSFGTTISPWIVSYEALNPFAVNGPRQDPQPLPYLCNADADGEKQHFDIKLEVGLKSPSMSEAEIICHSNSKYLYWSSHQQLTHHSITGCNMRPGDLLATGTISGPTEDSYGSLLELAWGGKKPLTLKNGETRTFIEDHDEIIMRAWAQGKNYRIGFGMCSGELLPAKDSVIS